MINKKYQQESPYLLIKEEQIKIYSIKEKIIKNKKVKIIKKKKVNIIKKKI
jgi:hypothetical protein